MSYKSSLFPFSIGLQLKRFSGQDRQSDGWIQNRILIARTAVLALEDAYVIQVGCRAESRHWRFPMIRSDFTVSFHCASFILFDTPSSSARYLLFIYFLILILELAVSVNPTSSCLFGKLLRFARAFRTRPFGVVT